MSSPPPLAKETGPSDAERKYPRYRPQVHSLNVETEEERAALSQRRNLLFTAQVDNIYVWIPSGPRQLLGSQPEMIIHPVMKEPNAAGYIDRSRPHTINHIIVDDLGVDEVLLLATDSGNVTGYNVEAIFSAINRSAKYGGKRPFDAREVKPFFAEHVQLSAWGLATHKFARLIAVSSNTGLITVFAFALMDVVSEGDGTSPNSSVTSNMGDSDVLENTWVYIETAPSMEELKKDMPHHRTRNLRLSYKGHFDNIPCVSFANFELDPNGLWMTSTDILNRVFVWRVWDSLSPVNTSSYDCPRSDQEQRGWFVLPLHPRRVQQHRLKFDACGCEPKPSTMNGRMIFDVSRAADYVENRTIIASEKVAAEERATISRLFLPADIFTPGDGVNTETRPQPSSSQHNHEASEAPSPTTAHDTIVISTESPQDYEVAPPRQSIRMRRGIANLIEEENEQWGTDCDVDVDILRSFVRHPCNPRFFPILHFSGDNITLDPYPLDHGLRTLCRSPLESMYLPELGMVIAASQAGGVAIITLTWQEEIGHTFRLDWLLPFPNQDGDDGGPPQPFMGIAASPMPGFEIPPDVPCIPRDVNPKDRLSFNHRLLNPDKDEHSATNLPEFGASSPSVPDLNPSPEDPNLTIPETHAYASDIYQPHETWHGYHPSRHYRLILLFCDLTVMSYEFWHDWRG
ncbi:Ribonucleotide reductase, transcriptional regulator CRT10 [Penicillium expansum]|uniref:Ribonucleotide reductase, transcriptional regulator CRT10 n=1 Tax=Penicillium expansum TaxID=27334 RepID=A0A0A2J5T2_PENEN|nr:Ribonucleotide reductase, transcriptional regulator CRT10 [Penicillium expansum]KGO49183.1 Ribonucleotide reductase, transcriptional regulator CRT10 [Penicillium expansum]KGO50752.1 Ribonucleotide reductase, transcriptional regulator CRT10 [Penicillium expansum]KGO54114.1 Ribonucleotide reductase, transcriptional regulator CRT10 [Penicillium expansum]